MRLAITHLFRNDNETCDDAELTQKASSTSRIVFLGDHFSREVEVARRTLFALAKGGLRNYEGYVLPQDIFADGKHATYCELARIRPHLIVTPTLNEAQAWLIPLAKLLGSKIIIQHSEQFLIEAAKEHKFESIVSLRLNDVAHLSWTEAHRAELIRYGVTPSHAHVSGSPKLLPSSQLVTKGPRRRLTVGFVSNFPLADMSSAELNRLKTTFGVTSNYQINLRLKTLRKRFIFLLAHNARTFTKNTFIVRAHPGESFEEYKAVLGQFPNVIYSRDETFSDFLADVDAVVMHDSTSIFEIAQREIPIFSVNLGRVNSKWEQQPSALFKGSRPRELTPFLKKPHSFGFRAQNPGLLREILQEMGSYDKKICDIYSEVLKNDSYRFRWRRIPVWAFRSFFRNLIVQAIDHMSIVVGIDIISTARRNGKKLDRYGHTLETVEIEV